MDEDKVRERIAFNKSLRDSSVGYGAWIDCPKHGRMPVDPYEENICVWCSAEKNRNE